nr:MAG TPA: hypothetical protein [Caudoviricetes sp.]DAY99652.1 MAG TPA: hypothetical protein [Caudoviricetes sp.]
MPSSATKHPRHVGATEPRHHCDFPILGEPVVAGLFVVSWTDLTIGGLSAVG